MGIIKKVKLAIGFACSMLYARISNKIVPTVVSLHVTKKCNLKCIHCYADLDSIKDAEEFSPQEIFDLIDKLAKLGTRKILLLGGEPLLRDDIEEIIDYIGKKGIICELYSNGYLVKEQFDSIKKVDLLHLSIDGDRQINDKLRGIGSYDKILEALEFLTSLKKCRSSVSLHFVVNHWNLNRLEHVADLAKKYQITFTINEYAVPAERALPELKLKSKEYQELYYQIRSLKKNGYPIKHSNLSLKYMLDYWPLPDNTILYKKDIKNIDCNSYLRCQLGRGYFFIDADANIYSCPLRWKQGVSFRDVGVYKALECAADRDCIICRELGFADTSSILSLKPQALLFSIKNYF